MADTIQELCDVLETCGVAGAADHNTIITHEGFMSIANLSILDGNSDVMEMAKRMVAQNAADGRVTLGTMVIKRLQALVWLVKDCQVHGVDINANDWDAAVMTAAMEQCHISKDDSEKALSVKDIGKFNLMELETYEDAFVNLLAQTKGVRNVMLCYVVHDANPPDNLETEEMHRMYQIQLAGEGYESDNHAIYCKLKEFLVNTPGYTWIEEFNATENGCAAFCTWTDHCNGPGKLDKRIKLAKAELKNLYYRNEKYLPFEVYTGKLKHIFVTLGKKDDECLS